jgi:hypothetical protein
MIDEGECSPAIATMLQHLPNLEDNCMLPTDSVVCPDASPPWLELLFSCNNHHHH